MGLYAIKEQNFMHRDLKLANIMVNFDAIEWSDTNDPDNVKNFDFAKSYSDITFKIADFGFAKDLGKSVIAQTICGTPATMAPE